MRNLWILIGILLLSFHYTDFERMDEGTELISLNQRGYKAFKFELTIGWQIVIDWKTDYPIDVYILSPQWDRTLPPKPSTILYYFYQAEMTLYRFKAPELGVYSFLFQNDHLTPRDIVFHWVIFKEKTAPPLATPQVKTQNPVLWDIAFFFIGFVALGVIAHFYRIMRKPKVTPRDRRIQQLKEQRKK